ncbi:MAG: hypothetical protein M1834_003535 [Cirrosporium novae-zelandiae]|nr:MAG: hypothetical protein M1834_003535 [Cirrosporium novae-zelandiae]
MERILDGLNDAQRTAVTSPSPVLQVLAPPGSGKTKTLTARVAYLLKHDGYLPWNIICCTFTIKAAREMRERISKLIGEGLESKLILGTFHSVCRRYLVAYGRFIGIKKGFGIADSSDSVAIIKRIVKRLKLSIDPAQARNRISAAKAKGFDHAQLTAKSARHVENQEFAKVFDEYQLALANSNLLDYDDLLLKCAELLRKHPECVANVEAVLIDEFQDTNTIQFDLMNLFAAQKRRVTIVGDPDQSIYGFRSAEIKNLTKMQHTYEKSLNLVLLEENYRSSSAILSLALQIIEQDTSRPTKPLHATHGRGTIPVLRKLPSAAKEARWIVKEIRRSRGMTGNLLNYSDYAILLRMNHLSRHIETALGNAGIPYRMVGGHRFFDRAEIKILLDYLRVIHQPENNDAFARIINIPSRRIGEASIKALLAEAEDKKTPLWTLVLDSVQGRTSFSVKLSRLAEQGLSSLVGMIITQRTKLYDSDIFYSPRQILEALIRKLSYKQYLEQTHREDYENRWANVEELLGQAKESIQVEIDDSLPGIEGVDQEEEEAASAALSKFLANIALSSEVRTEDGEESDDKVTISTIHAAKGLEWPVVFIPAVYEGSIPHSRSEDRDEERRLLYVAMTRAQALLYLSVPSRASQGEETSISPYLLSKNVMSLFCDKGPAFHYHHVESISRILRRVCPQESDVLDCMQLLPTTEDLFEEEDEDNSKRIRNEITEGGRYHGDTTVAQLHKRQKLESHNSFSVYREHHGEERSMTGSYSDQTANASGFVTATAELKCQSSRISSTSQAKTRKLKPINSQQKSLMSYFGNKHEGNEEREASPDLPVVPEASWNNQSTRRNGLQGGRSWIGVGRPDYDQSIDREPMLPIPESLSNHQIQPLSSWRPQKTEDDLANGKRYVFLSSSPPRDEKPTQQENADEKPQYQTARAPPQSKSLGHNYGVRPASSFHITTVQKLQNAKGRKTLGVRRTMNGWKSQSGKGFSVPRATCQQRPDL